MAHASFEGLQRTFVHSLFAQPMFQANMEQVSAFVTGSSKIWTHAFKILVLVSHYCHRNGPGFTVRSVKMSDGSWRNGYNEPLQQLNAERARAGVPHRIHAIDCPGCAGITPGTGYQARAHISDAVLVRSHLIACDA